ncbi:MAG: hypothetical protein IKQ62_06800 [Bacteroidaceae bacterium]|nr:hypothetical protein [Bacteroidaceae bacterium]
MPDSKRGRWREQTKGRFMFRRGVVGWGQKNCQFWQPLSRSPSSSLMKDVNVCVMMPDQP